MSERLTKAAARNIFYGGTLFFVVIFLGLVFHTVSYVGISTDVAGLTESVVRGKRTWERHSCINCHTILGEGAYFAPELGNVWTRYDGGTDPAGARDFIKNWIRTQPTGIEGRRQMPHFDISEPDLDALVDFFEWVDRIDNQNWPPTDAG